MADLSATLRRAKATFTSSGGATGDTVTLSAALNDFARAQATVYPPASGTAEIPYSAIASMMGKIQTRAVGAQASGFTAKITSDSDSISFSGVETGPSFTVAPGAFTPGISAIHAASRLHELDMSMYPAPDISVYAAVKDADVIVRLRLLIRALVDSWRRHVFPTLTKADGAAALKVHQANVIPLQILDAILEASPERVIPEFQAVQAAMESIDGTYNTWMMSTLQVEAGGFVQAFFLDLLKNLGLLYVPSISDDSAYGKLISVEQAFATAEERSNCDGVTFQPQLQVQEVPVTRVVIAQIPTSGLYSAYVTEGKAMPGQTAPGTVQYPADVQLGARMVIPPPPFLSYVFQNLKGGIGGYGAKLPAGQARQAIEETNELVQLQTDAVRLFLQAHARNLFGLVHLQGSHAGMTVPLDVSWQVGKAYKVGIKGSSMFLGLLQAVSHTVSSNAGGAQAFTQLQFSYVQWGAFRAKW